MIGVIIQARMESKRLPGKVYKKISGKHLFEHVVLRIKKSKLAKRIAVAVPDTKKNSVLLNLAKKHKIDFYKGSLNNVLLRYIEAAEKFQIDPIIRVTADCPLIDPVLIDKSIKRYAELKKKPDYFFIEGYPRGTGDIEIITLDALKKSIRLTDRQRDLEHVVTFILENPNLFDIKIEKAPAGFFRPDYRVCVDEKPDLILVKKIFSHFKNKKNFFTKDVVGYLDENSNLPSINKNVKQTI